MLKRIVGKFTFAVIGALMVVPVASVSAVSVAIDSFKGTWKPASIYGAGVVVIYKSQTFLSLVGGNKGRDPTKLPKFWQLVGGNTGGPQGLKGDPGASLNVQQIAMKRWYSANTTASVPVQGTCPHEAMYDGRVIWSGNTGDSSVLSFEPSNGKPIDGIQTGGTGGLGDIAFDGLNYWAVTTNTTPNVRKFDYHGNLLGSATVGTGPYRLAFDGTNMWVSDFVGNAVYRLNVSSLAVTGPFAVGNAPQGLMFDGTFLWVANSGDNTVMKLDKTSGAQVGTFQTGPGPSRIAFDGVNVWVTNHDSNTVSRLRASDGGGSVQFVVGQQPDNIIFDGSSIVITNPIDETLVKIDPKTGSVISSTPVGSGGVGISGLTFDGANYWVTGCTTNRLYKM